MKYLAILSLSAIFFSCFIVNSEALQCYECTGCSGSNIGTLTNCTDTREIYCKNVYVSALGVTTATKTCAIACTATNTGSILGTGGGTTCCSTDGCNSSNMSTQIKAGLLILALSTIIAFFMI